MDTGESQKSITKFLPEDLLLQNKNIYTFFKNLVKEKILTALENFYKLKDKLVEKICFSGRHIFKNKCFKIYVEVC